MTPDIRQGRGPARPAAPADTPREARRTLALFAILAAIVVAVYWRAIDAPFVFDDRTAIVENPSTLRLWPPIGDAEAPGPLNPPSLAPTSRRPLVNLTFAVDRRLHGLRPAPYRAENLVLHVLAAAVLAALVRRTLRLPRFGDAWTRAAWPLSAAIAVLWAVHPLNTESVAYVTQRTEILGGLFYLTVLWASLRYWGAASPTARAGWLAVATLACLAGVASKEIVVSAPLVVLLLERTFLVSSFRDTRRSWPLYAGLALSWLLLVALNAGGIGGLSDPRNAIPLHVWWMTQAKVLFLYLKLALWPWPLSIHYAPAYLRTLDAAWPWIAAAALLATATVALVRRLPATLPVVAVIVFVLAPTFVIPLPKMMAAERRMYLPLAGLIVLAAVGAYRLLSARLPGSHARLAAVVATALVAAASAGTVARLAAYDTVVTLWADAVAHQPDDPMSRYNLGVALLDEHRPEQAMTRFEETLRLDPEHAGALDNLGLVLTRLGRPADAIPHLERALRIDADDAVAHNNLGAALIALGRPPDALPHLRRALALTAHDPNATVHLNLGRALLDVGSTAEGLRELEAAVRLSPDDTDARFSLGVALANAGRPRDALPHLDAAVRAAPSDAEAQNALGSALLRTGDTSAAIARYRRALALAPTYVEAHSNLGAALLDRGELPEAIAELEQALRLAPDHPAAHYNLGAALLRAGRPREAITPLRRAVELRPEDARARFQAAIAHSGAGEPAESGTAARGALDLARAQGESALAEEIEAWIARNRPEPAG